MLGLFFAAALFGVGFGLEVCTEGNAAWVNILHGTGASVLASVIVTWTTDIINKKDRDARMRIVASDFLSDFSQLKGWLTDLYGIHGEDFTNQLKMIMIEKDHVKSIVNDLLIIERELKILVENVALIDYSISKSLLAKLNQSLEYCKQFRKQIAIGSVVNLNELRNSLVTMSEIVDELMSTGSIATI